MAGAQPIAVATVADAGEVARLLAEFRDWMGKDVPTGDELRAGIERIASGGEGEYLLAGEPRALGVCQLRYRWSVWTAAPDCWLEDLYVSGPARGGGLGRALIEAAVERARERGCKRIELDVDDANVAALALYESCGFSTAFKAAGRSLLAGRRI